MSLFKRKSKKEKSDKNLGAEEAPAKSEPKDINNEASPVSPDVSGSPKGKRNAGPPPSQQVTKQEDEAQEDERLEERKSLMPKISGLIGKDIASLVSLPVSFFEPISVLQSMAEPMRNVELLNKACECDDPVERLCRIAAFCVSLFSYYVRTAKPFNPVLGETYEFEPTSKQYRTIAEQVSHHPPVGICHSESQDWTLCQESRIETKFWGTSVDVNSVGNNVLTIKKYNNEEIRWKNPTAVIHNIILGRLWIEYHGNLPITNYTTGHVADLKFKKHSFFSSSSFAVSGEVKDKDGKVKAILVGNWKEEPYMSMFNVDEHGKKVGEPIELWKRVYGDLELTHKWKWDGFIHELSALSEEQERHLPPTDARLRGDIRALKGLNNKLAGKEKTRIEEKERVKRKEREASGKAWKPVFFRKVPDDKSEYRWEYAGGYFEERENRMKAASEKHENDLKEKANREEDEGASEQPVSQEEESSTEEVEEEEATNEQKLDTTSASSEVVA